MVNGDSKRNFIRKVYNLRKARRKNIAISQVADLLFLFLVALGLL